MDKKHREYCIKLGNPYYINEEKTTYKEPTYSWEEVETEENGATDNWLKNSKKFTN